MSFCDVMTKGPFMHAHRMHIPTPGK